MRVRAKFKRREDVPPELLCCDYAFSRVRSEPFSVDTGVTRRCTGSFCQGCGQTKGRGMPLLHIEGDSWVYADAIDLDEGGAA